MQALVAGLRQHCDTYVSMPGINSPYLYTGEPAPEILPGPWAYVRDADDQAAIVDELRSIPRLCAVTSPGVQYVWSLLGGGEPPQGPLIQFIDDDFRPVATYGLYTLAARSVP
jgi:hypothetical protein